MSSSLEPRHEKNPNDLDRFIYGRISRRDTDDIGIVMLSRESCDLWSPDESRSDSCILVRGHRHTVRRTTEEDAICRLPSDHIVTDWMRRVRIVHRVRRVGSMIQDSMPE